MNNLKIVLILLVIFSFGCKGNVYRKKLYRIHPINSGVVRFEWLDSAYRAGDTVNLGQYQPCLKKMDYLVFIVEERAK